ncbi:uncharacterized protein [Physcomitrium patens]|uniref:Heparan-alpha-glucosaminide N-acetyltransferase catalytic domain-containing protein n=1 Tax=Physcomitrium patens TaxID=3218 RepID=A0A7I4AY33_PHYPA|nr:heparan-alpha-glucosaminide N-acetyltransferase-like isoform X2 [Physcomitrium patens]|eukprot:XP_024393658.1 heparan-alpha-glucosaminide N-acetyltransferase-like isoform X2 [Physcomitrella patens]
MAGEDVEVLEEAGLRAEVEPVLLQPLVEGGGGSGYAATAAEKSPRLASLDVFRGLSIAVMILVDNAGGVWPSINHSPWTGITLADFVMPFFLFIVGVALALTYKRITRDKKVASQKALGRTAKLLIVGLVIQGGYFHGLHDTSYGVDLERIRWCGVLQRIALAYMVVALCEIWAPRRRQDVSNDNFAIFKTYHFHWAVAAAIVATYLALLYGVYVPDWDFIPPTVLNSTALHVHCGVRGNIGPACNAVGYLDRTILGVSHLYQRPVFRRTPACSVNSPDYGPLPSGAPDWCKAPFDPEGLLSSLSAVGSCFLGLHFGHVLVHRKEHIARLWDWMIMSLVLLIVGLLLHLLGVPFNKPLYSVSYMLFTGGAAGVVFAGFYLLVDVYGWRGPTFLLEWLGQNALLMYVLVAEGVFPAALQGIYWRKPENNLVAWVVNNGPWHKQGLTHHRVPFTLSDLNAA